MTSSPSKTYCTGFDEKQQLVSITTNLLRNNLKNLSVHVVRESYCRTYVTFKTHSHRAKEKIYFDVS